MTTTHAASGVRPSVSGAAIQQLMADRQPVELVRTYRSGTHENSHCGSLVILDRDGSVLVQRGDVDRPVFHRSCAKPFQAVAMLELNAPLAGADLALAAASHSGEPEHVHRTLRILERTGFTEDDLGCPAALPADPAAYRSVIRGSGAPRRVYMNCSGKHAAMLATCRAQAWPSAGYLHVDHPLQQRIRAVLESATGEVPAAVAVDGCGAPVYATSLPALARAFGALTAAHSGSAERLVADAMRQYPAMVGGTGVDDTRLMQAVDGLLVKGGADGVHCAALPDGRSIALKIADGSDRARMPLLVGALRSRGLGARSGPTRDLLNELAVGTVLGGGRPVGTVEIVPGLFS
jgi:L-asparaginase II